MNRIDVTEKFISTEVSTKVAKGTLKRARVDGTACANFIYFANYK
jgi:hypothetical protein